MFGKERPMNEEFRKLNNAGIERFKAWIKNGGKGLLPQYLLESTQYSFPTDYAFSTELPEFETRYDFGEYLSSLLETIPFTDIEGDMHFWTTLALVWFDRICSKDDSDKRKIQEPVRYVLDLKFHNFRHLVKTPWALVRQYGKDSKFLLTYAGNEENQLSVVSDALNQFGGREALLRNERIVKLFSKLYYDHQSDTPKKIIGSRVGGGPRRAGIILRQLSLNYDLEWMTEKAIFNILPREFDRWKEGVSFD